MTMNTNDNGSKENDLLLSHEYDGIHEYDNPMPRWWVWTFWGTFFFSLGYFIHYHVTGNGQSVAVTYDAELSIAREREAMQAMGGEATEDSLTNLMLNGAMMSDASKLFVQRCAQCHGSRGEGLIGPNLTDNYWLHGNASLMAIHQVVSEGVQSKGMPPWKKQLRPIELGKVSAYLGTLRGTNLSGPKGAEGQLVEMTPRATDAKAAGEPDDAPPATLAGPK
jgi:cytochrome c oxidase cbb3-type subunit III